MDRIVIEYQSQDNGHLSKLLLAAVMDVLKQGSVKQVCISQDRQQCGSRRLFAYAGLGGGANGI